MPHKSVRLTRIDECGRGRRIAIDFGSSHLLDKWAHTLHLLIDEANVIVRTVNFENRRFFVSVREVKMFREAYLLLHTSRITKCKE